MKKDSIISAILTTVIAVFIVVVTVYAGTIIDSNINTDGNMTIGGNATVSGNLTVTGTISTDTALQPARGGNPSNCGSDSNGALFFDTNAGNGQLLICNGNNSVWETVYEVAP